jgi:hypothetical protein
MLAQVQESNMTVYGIDLEAGLARLMKISAALCTDKVDIE